MKKASVVIVSPALADANNGNWQTARRWQRMLTPDHKVRIVQHWPDVDAQDDGAMLALHARRSAASIAAWAQARGPRGLAVVLTGTDLYRDIATDAAAQQSLTLAQQLVVLQDQGPLALPEAVRAKARVIFQSATARRSVAKTPQHLRALMVGHLRDEKDPLTLMAAARLLHPGDGILLDHIGAPLEPTLGQAAEDTARACPHYRWLGAQAHEATRRRIQHAHLLVHASRMEGGAHVIMEAVCSGTPVLASRVPGNVGMLGPDYAGYFDLGDARGLAHLLRQCRTALQAPRPDDLLATLHRQCAVRARLFSPQAERAALRGLVQHLLKS